NYERVEPVEEVRIAVAADHHCRLAGNRDSHILGHLEAANAGPFLFSDENSRYLLDPVALLGGQKSKVAHPAAQQSIPVQGEGFAQDALAAAIADPAENHRFNLPC